MKSIKFAAVALAMTISGAVAGVAQAVPFTVGGVVPEVCTVALANTGININDASLQRIANVNVTCNRVTGTRAFAITATNGAFSNGAPAFNIDYLVSYDFQGQVSGNAVQFPLSNVGAGGSIGSNLTSSEELGRGLPGTINVDLLSTPWAAGNYQETFNVTIG
jgi:hypothetical protein